MKAFYCDSFVLPLPEGHRFPIRKYRLLRERVLAQGILEEADLSVPAAATDEQLMRVHDAGYVDRVVRGELDRAELRRIGFPWSPQMVERSRRSAGGTIAACRAVIASRASRAAVNLAGGTHHAFRDRGEGYCVFNDAAIAIRALQAEGLVERALVVDCDVHQGNGTAAIFAGDPTVFTFSVHGRHNFPFHKERSDLDVELDNGTGDAVYLAALDEGLDRAFRFDRLGEPDLVIYVAGADPHEGDRLGRLAVTKEGLRARDRRVFAGCRDRDLPVAVVMAGGYGHDIDVTVDVHVATVEEAKRYAET